jgi:predicted aspartyl protease
MLVTPLIALAMLQSAEAPSLAELIADRDIAAVEARIDNAENEVVHWSAIATMMTVFTRDERAVTLLNRLLDRDDVDPALRRELTELAADAALRSGQYAQASARLSELLAGDSLEATEREHMARTAAIVAALADESPQTRPRHDVAEIDIARDAAGLRRVEMAVNGVGTQAVLDSGASFSVVREAMVAPLGLRRIAGTFEVAAGHGGTVEAGLVMADGLEIGNSALADVVFLVLPDDALTFLGGQYTIDVIAGFPVIYALDRLTFARTEAGETLAFGGEPAHLQAPSNLILEGLQPIVLANLDGTEQRLRLFLDTGATATLLDASALARLPEAWVSAEAGARTIAGAGGEAELSARTVQALPLRFGETVVPLADISLVTAPDVPGQDGILGQDVLNAGSGYVIDFYEMRFEILGLDS